MGPWETTGQKVRIVRRPLGEAPEWVRDAWIGLELPVLLSDPVSSRIAGVLTGSQTRLGFWFRFILGRTERMVGYLVDAHTALRLLEARNPTAAIWWRANAGWCVQPGCQFVFDLPACEPVG